MMKQPFSHQTAAVLENDFSHNDFEENEEEEEDDEESNYYIHDDGDEILYEDLDEQELERFTGVDARIMKK